MAPFHNDGSSQTLTRRTPNTVLWEEHSKVFHIFPENGFFLKAVYRWIFLLPHLHLSVFIFLLILTAVMTLLSHPSLFLFQLQHSSTVLQSFVILTVLFPFFSFLFSLHSWEFFLIYSRAYAALLANIFILVFLSCPLCTVMFPCVPQINLHPHIWQFSLLHYPLWQQIIIKCT